MARIRTIKPEFPQSESMGRVSRSARLLFILLWPICDDHGRTRAASRMLASLLFPYDDDAMKLLPVWLDELEREGCIKRYELGGSSYLEVCKWQAHQKIDRPSKPQFPEPSGLSREDDTIPREDSSLEGRGKEWNGMEACPHDSIITLYHEILPTGTRVKSWTDTRKAHLRSRWREEPKRQNLDYWKLFFSKVSESDFLMGKAHSKDRKPFKVALDWLVNSENFVKVIEGKYDNGGQQ